jgi:hypothetical protein
VQRVLSKQHGLLSPSCNLEQVTLILFLRVSGFAVERIHLIQSY